MKASFYKYLELKPIELLLVNKDNIKAVNELNELMLSDIKNILDTYCKVVLSICEKESKLINNQIKNN